MLADLFLPLAGHESARRIGVNVEAQFFVYCYVAPLLDLRE